LSLYDAIETVEHKYELFDVKIAPVPDASAEMSSFLMDWQDFLSVFPPSINLK
jgi:hypothetical protein